MLRLLIECEDAAVVSARNCDTFRADLYNGLQCPQCVAPANAVAAASAVCEAIPTAAQCLPDAAGGAEFEDHTVLGDAIAPAPGGLVLGDGARLHSSSVSPLLVLYATCCLQNFRLSRRCTCTLKFEHS